MKYILFLLILMVAHVNAQSQWIYWTQVQTGKTSLHRLRLDTRQVESVKDSVILGKHFQVDAGNSMIYTPFGMFDMTTLAAVGFFGIFPEDWYQYESVILDRRMGKLYREVAEHNSAVGADLNPFYQAECFDTKQRSNLQNRLYFGSCNANTNFGLYTKNIVPDGKNGYFFQGREQSGGIYSYYIGYRKANGTVERIFTEKNWNEFTVSYDDINLKTVFYFVADGKIYKQDSAETQAQLFFDNLQNPRNLGLNMVDGKIYWLEDNRISRANLDGSSLEVLIGNLVAPEAMVLSFEQNYLVDKDAVEIPQNIGLASFYPNPFTQETVLQYELLNDGAVSLNIFDALGRRIFQQDLQNQSAGVHRFTLDKILSSGIYFWRLSTLDGVQSGKIIRN